MDELTAERAPGPSPSFSNIHAIKALELIAKGPVGRKKLAKELKLGEGATRTLIDRLKDYELATVSRVGCSLTKKGEKFWKALHNTFPRKVVLEKSGLTLAPFNIAILIKGCAGRVAVGMEQRDAALSTGAKGATTLLFKNDELVIPPDWRSVAKDFPRIHKEIVRSLMPMENDVVVIGSADTLEKAEYGALAAALSLLNGCSPST